MAAIPYAFDDIRSEHAFQPLQVEGTLPADMRGTVVYNGPGLRRPFGQPSHHWFDGDGAVRGVRFRDGQAFGAARVVQGRGLQQERAAGRPLFDTYSARHASLWQRWHGQGGKNVANTSVLFWQEQLYALVESSQPTQLRAADLSTVGESSLGEVVRGAFSAHPHRVPARRATYNHGLANGSKPHLNLYELPDAGPARLLGELPLRFGGLIHDFIATANHLIFFISPVRLRTLPYMLGASFCRALHWEPQRGTEVVVVPIDTPEAVVRFDTEAFFQWHFSNAFERDGAICVDLVRYANFDCNVGFAGNANNGEAKAPMGDYQRVRLDLRQRSLTFEPGTLLSNCEFPKVAPSEETCDATFAYAVQFGEAGQQPGLPSGLAKIDLRTGAVQHTALGEGHMPSEALFLPRENPRSVDDGYLVSLVIDPHEGRSYGAVIDAREFSAGPVARVWFDQALPLSFHGVYMPN